MRRKKTKINKTRSEKGEKITSTKEIQGIIKDYFENLHINKLENLEETENFLYIQDHPKLNQEDINHLHRSITCNDIKIAIVSQKRKSRT
jgi:hypothetical protein